MRKILIAGLLIVSASMSNAAINYDYQSFWSSGKPSVAQGTITISTVTPSIITTDGNFTEIKISSAAVQYYYKVDGSTVNISSEGYPVAVGESATIQSVVSDKIVIQGVPAGTSQTLRYMKTQPK